ncbi:CNBP [Mytilus edulis]|uniref:CNBP n=1 Tax=Mytilus edulis TaxID=6550 RepID=A0A8S3PY60_MYTED|nr:CNBP [Mytilus edulis]
MADGNVDPKSSTKSYAEAVSPKDKTSNDQSVSEVKPIFILEQDLFGSNKPSQDQYLTHLELYRSVEHLVDPSHLKALQRVRGLWRLYFDNQEDRDKTLTNGLVIRKKLIQTYARNPKTAENEDPNNVRVRIKNIPCSADDGQIQRALEVNHCVVHTLFRERLRVDGRVTNCQTGDRIAICDPIPNPLPKTLFIGKYKAVVLHRGQVDTRTNIKCNKCLQEGHKSYECPNDWVCRTCGGSGHKASYCTTCPDDWVCQTCGKSGHTAKYCNADSDSSSEDSQSESESDSDIPTHPESCQKDVSQTTQAADAEHKTPSFTFNKQASNNLEDHSNLSEKKANRQVKKAKRAKNKKDKQNTNKDQPSMERFLAEAFRTPSNKTNEEKKTRTKQTASTPTDELHKREEPVKKTKS